ncbi:Flp pilus assembly protein CpaB [Pseudonocardia thermophila]|uniref:Flp pilus assembly protein CpaB n=1 Tax=Pseudonocardia thermophila TaxID=1848 RepID=A0A1M6RJM6_PSETH|nr:SAF domain-containing protein [Pseudonocardia thermophila]SHK32652.1 Flp pilus assembly protein CpaB [Pseudonocardia thermophila]
MPDPLAAHLSERMASAVRAVIGGPSWRRTLRVRRTAAAVLAGTALVLVAAPRAGPSAGAPVLVAAAELPAGTTVRAADLAVREWPADLVPVGALRSPDAAEGRVLVGAAHPGEPLTDVRLVGGAPVPHGTAAVPVRIADAAVAALLVPGNRVDVVTVGARAEAPSVLAADAPVLAVLPEEKGARGRLVLVGMSRDAATRVASATLTDQVTITLR